MTRRRMQRPTHKVSLAGVVACLALALAGCGSSHSTSGSAAGANGGQAGSSQANAVLSHASGTSTQWPGPDSAPAPAKHKRVFILAAVLASITKDNVAGIVQAAHLMGWQTRVYNGQANPSDFAQGLEQALNEHYNAVILSAITPQLVSTQLAALRRANIPVIESDALTTPSPTTVNADVNPASAVAGRIMAAEVTRESGGHAQILTLNDNEFPVGIARERGFEDGIAQFCPSCKIVTHLQFTASQLGTPDLGTEIQNKLRSDPSINYVYAAYDDVAVDAVQAIHAAGLAGKVKLASVYGEAQNINFVKTGDVQFADLGIPLQWLGYETVDTLNRIFHGAKGTSLAPAVTGLKLPQTLLTPATLKQHPVPTGQAWEGQVDYVQHYKRLWGLG